MQDCAVCHAVDGSGSFQGPDIRHSGTAAVDFMVRTGRMPAPLHTATAGRLLPSPTGATAARGPVRYSDTEIRQLVGHTATFVTGPEVPTSPTGPVDIAAGGELYRSNCASCHQMAGSGGALAYGTSAPPLDRATPAEVVEAMRVGPGSMPVFSPADIDDRGAADIAAYVQQLRRPDDRGGAGLGHLGPVPEGFVAWSLGIGAIVLFVRWLGKRSRIRTE